MKYNILSILIVISTFIACLLCSSSIVETSMYIVSFFYDYMFPSLLPLLISIFILLDTGVLNYLAYLLQYITLPVLKVNGYGAICILVAILTGFPFSTLLICKYYKESKLTKEEAYSIICSFTIPSFSFLFTTIKLTLNTHNFVSIVCCLYLSSFILLFILSKHYIKYNKLIPFKEIHTSTKNNITHFSFASSLKNNIIKITESLSIVLGTMVYFSVLTILIESFIPISTTIKGLIEFSFPSVIEAKKGNIFSLLTILSFSSISCLFQCSCILEDYKLKTKPLVLSKMIQPLISLILFTI